MNSYEALKMVFTAEVKRAGRVPDCIYMDLSNYADLVFNGHLDLCGNVFYIELSGHLVYIEPLDDDYFFHHGFFIIDDENGSDDLTDFDATYISSNAKSITGKCLHKIMSEANWLHSDKKPIQ